MNNSQTTGRRVVCDLETNGLHLEATTIWCGVAKDIDTGQVFKFRPHEMYKLTEFLDTCSVVIGHNFIDFDEYVLQKILNYKLPENTFVIDTYILSQMLEPDRQKHPRTKHKRSAHSLENFGNIFKRYKPEYEDWSKYTEEMLHRCSEDVEINYLAFKMMNRKALLLQNQSVWKKPYKIEAAFARCLRKQQTHGFLVDKAKIEAHIQYLTDEIDKIDAEVIPQLPKRIEIKEQKVTGKDEYKWFKNPFKGNGDLCKRALDWCNNCGYEDSSIIGGEFSRFDIVEFDLGSIKQVKEYLLEQGWVPEEWNTKKDPATGVESRTSPKLSKTDAFVGVTSDVGRQVANRMIYRHRRSQLEGFLKIIRDDGRITAGVTGITPTCRLKHAGIVNIPGSDAVFGNEMREVFIVPKGYKLIGCDAASCQLRDLCHYMDDPEYTQAVINGNKEDGSDIHSVNMRATGLSDRTQAKRFIYAFIFGAGNKKLAAILGITEEEVKKVRKRYLENLPKFKKLVETYERFFASNRYVPGLDGRPIYPRGKHEILAYLLQSAEAIMMKVATCYAFKWIEAEGLDAHMVAHVHDEMQWEVKEEHVKRVAELLEQSIVKAGEWLKMKVPMAGEADTGENWKETH